MTGSRRLGIILLAAAAALAPGSTARSQATKAPGLVQGGNYDSGNLGMQMQPAPHTDDAGAVYTVGPWPTYTPPLRSEEHTSELQSRLHLVCRLLLEKKKEIRTIYAAVCTETREGSIAWSPPWKRLTMLSAPRHQLEAHVPHHARAPLSALAAQVGSW